MTPFPEIAPFRVDQVIQAPLPMAYLFIAQGLTALLIQIAGILQRRRLWLGAVVTFLMLVLVFFTLASWGNSDTTRFSHYMEWDPERAPPELLWRFLRPLLLLLPYRMAAVQGLVATAFAAAPILLAAHWRAWPWAGWWSLLITCSPLLRGFLQNAHTRQALAVVLLLPLFLQAARLVRIDRRWVGLGVILSALSHNTFVLNLPISLLPLVVRLPEVLKRLVESPRALSLAGLRRRWPWLLAAIVVVGLLLAIAPTALDRFFDYASDDYFNSYSQRAIVGRFQRALAYGLLVGCVQARLDPRRLLRCPITLLLLVFGLIYLAIQASITQLWLPQITSRLADGVAFFMLILYISWLHRYRGYWGLFPPLYIAIQYWLEGRILYSATFDCGHDDQFLCVPDRWPWQVRY
ncbi:MAG: hypothetical protein VKK99_05310 [Cyanobacteriota bacterium]|nr:hypothetical protein [Cyanobacteriota bacterium]